VLDKSRFPFGPVAAQMASLAFVAESDPARNPNAPNRLSTAELDTRTVPAGGLRARRRAWSSTLYNHTIVSAHGAPGDPNVIVEREFRRVCA